MLPKGQRISHYRLLRRLKVGGMGEIYLAADERLARQVAIKVIAIDFAHYDDVEAAAEAARLFLREARAIARFNHNHILHIYEADEEIIDNISHMYMVMPFCPEGSLADWLSSHAIPLPLAAQDVEHIVAQAAEALQLAHDHHIIHQDVKPGNFLVQQATDYPDQLKLQLADFGVAKLLKTTSESQSVRGTPFYMAPEQWEGHAVPATDQYSLAVMAYELLTGYRPFRGNNSQQIWYQHFHVTPRPPSSVNPLVPHILDTVIQRALAKNPRARYPSITAFAHAFQRASRRNTNAALVAEEHEALAPAAMATLPPTVHVATQKRVPAVDLPAPGRSGIKGKTILILSLVLLVIAASTTFFLYNQWQGQRANISTNSNSGDSAQTATGQTAIAVQQTGTAQAQQTGTAQSNAAATSTAGAATATASVSAHATATAAARATATAYARATATTTAFYGSLGVSGKPTFSDSLQNNNQGHHWDQIALQDGSCAFTQGTYHATAAASAYAPCFAQSTNYQNLADMVTLQFVKGDEGGMIFGGDPKSGNFYAFVIGTNGDYALNIYQNYTVTQTPAQGNSSLIHTGAGQSNMLAVKVANGTITLFINMQPLKTVIDSTYNGGAIGVIAESINAPTDVAFSSAEVWKL